MDDTFFYVEQYATLAGWRLIVLANRLGCEDPFSRMLHDRLLSGLQGAIGTTRRIIELLQEDAAQAGLEDNQIDWTIPCELANEQERFAGYSIELLDELEIDGDTHEYRVNGGEWRCALTADCDGVAIHYPKTVALSDAELGSLAPIIRGIAAETGISIRAARVDYG